VRELVKYAVDVKVCFRLGDGLMEVDACVAEVDSELIADHGGNNSQCFCGNS
jgi:hypothetical protein